MDRAIKDGWRLAQTAGFPNMAVTIRLLDGVLRVMGGESDAYPSCLDAYGELGALDLGWLTHLSEVCLAVAAELVGDQYVATAHTLKWVRFCRRSGVRLMLTCGIRGAARLSAKAGHPDESLRLWAGAEQVEAMTGLRYMPLMERLDQPHRQQCIDSVGPQATRMFAEGASWSVAEATQLAEEALVRLQAENDGLKSN